MRNAKWVASVMMTILCTSTLARAEDLLPLPEYTKTMSDGDYAAWAVSHNQNAYTQARRRAKVFRKHPLPVTVTTRSFRNNQRNRSGYQGIYRGLFGPPNQSYANGVYKETVRTYQRDTWGGGPVVIFNPYCR